MKPQWDAQVTQLNAARTQWGTYAASLPEIVPLQQPPSNIPRNSITETLSKLATQLELLNQQADIDPLLIAVHHNGLVSTINGLAQSISTVQQNRNPQHFQQLVNYLWGLESTLVWLAPGDLAENMARRIGDKNFIGRLRKVEKLSEDLASKANAINEAASKASQSMTEMGKLIEDIRGFEREAGTAKTNSQANAAQTVSDRQAIEKALQELSTGVAKQTELLKEIGNLREQADQTLEGASKVGLARAFAERRKILDRTQMLWAGLFIVTIAAIVYVPSNFITAIFPAQVTDKLGAYWSLLLHVIVSAPLVWLAWFCAIQYSTTTRLMEDYAFKEAAALSYVGYSRELSSDTEMVKRLQDSALRTFASNPARLLNKRDHITPAHSLLDVALEKLGIEKITELLSGALNKSKD